MAHPDALRAGLTGAAKKLSPKQVTIVFQEGQVEVSEKLHVLVFHPKFLGGVPVDDLISHCIRNIDQQWEHHTR